MSDKVLAGAQGSRRVPADLPSARLPDLRQGRRVPAAEPDPAATARARSRFVYDDKMHLDKHVPLGRLDLPRPRALHPVRALHPLPGRDRRRPGARLLRARAQAGDRHLLRPGLRLRTSPATRPTSARSGALTTTDFRFGARPWELNAAASICPHCPVGCNLTLNTRREADSRRRAKSSSASCRARTSRSTKSGFATRAASAHHYASSADRLPTPLVRREGQLVEVHVGRGAAGGGRRS